MRVFIAALIFLLSTPLAAQIETSDRDSQWIFLAKHGDGSESPTAIFLSSNYSAVIMKAECQADEFGNPGKPGNGGITLYYYPDPPMIKYDTDGSYIKQPFEPFYFSRGEEILEFPAEVTAQSVNGSVAVTPKLLAILQPSKDELGIGAANEMDEPWYAGQALPLYELAKACAKK